MTLSTDAGLPASVFHCLERRVTATRIKTLFVILKLAERCNLACNYCYYYAPGQDAAVYARPSLMSPAVLEQVVTYLAQALDDVLISNICFVFHGGEPTLARARVVREFCRQANIHLRPHLRSLQFLMQTNGMHMPDEWLELVRDESISVGVSIDGDRATHDAERVDHRGRGSYDRIRANVARLNALADAGVIPPLSAISVMSESFAGLASYRHLVDDLGLRQIEFLFPDFTRDTLPTTPAGLFRLGNALCATFDHWLLHDRDRVLVRLYDNVIRRTLVASHRAERIGESALTVAMGVLSDGATRLPDDLMAPTAWFASQLSMSVYNSTLAQWLAQPCMRELIRARTDVPTGCVGCAHAATCAGGDLPNRHSLATGFDNPSAYCSVLDRLHTHVATVLRDGHAELARRQQQVPPTQVPA